MRRGAEVIVKCRCGAQLSIPAKLPSVQAVVEMFLLEHSSCRPSPPPPLPRIVKEPATEGRGI